MYQGVQKETEEDEDWSAGGVGQRVHYPVHIFRSERDGSKIGQYGAIYTHVTDVEFFHL